MRGVLALLCMAVAMILGGASVALASPPTYEDLRGVAFVDENVGYAVGSSGAILKTVDGGANWAVIEQFDFAYEFRGVAASGSTVWAVGRYGQLVRSVDAGANWTVLAENIGSESGQTAMLNAVESAPLGQLFTAGTAMENMFPLLYVSDGTGTQFPLADLRTGNTYVDEFENTVGLGEFYDVELIGEAHVWAVGHDDYDDGSTDHNDGVIWEYDGASWQERKNIPASGPLYGVSFGSPDWGIAVGAAGQVQYTTDGGDTWIAGNAGFYENLYAVATGTMGQAWAVGDWGTLLATWDYGATWTPLYNPAGSTFYDVTATGGTSAVAVGGFGSIITTTDGVNWEIPSSILAPPSISANPGTDVVAGSEWLPLSIVDVWIGEQYVPVFTDSVGAFVLDPQDVPDLQAGDIIIANSGFTSKVLYLDAAFTITEISAPTDMIFGTLPAGCTVSVFASLPSGPATLDASVDDGDWVVDFYSQGLDLPPGQTGTATCVDDDGDMYVQDWGATASAPTVTVNLTTDTYALSDWTPGQNVTVTIYDGQTELWQTTADITGTGRASGQTGAFDVQAGQRVVATASGGSPSKELLLDASLAVTGIDTSEDVMTGAGPAGGAILLTKSSVTPLPRVNFEASGTGDWTVDCSSAWDIAPGDHGDAVALDADGDATAISWRASMPIVIIDPWSNDLWLEDWTASSSVDVSIDTGQGDPFTATLPTDEFGGAHTVVEQERDLSNAHVTATDGETSKQLVVDPSFAVGWVDTETNSVAGLAAPNTMVTGEMTGEGWTVTAEASTGAGTSWSMTFDSQEHDLDADSSGTVSIADADLDRVSLHWQVADPHVKAQADPANVAVDGFSPRAQVDVYVGPSAELASCTWAGTILADEDGCGSVTLGAPIADGMYVHAVNAGREHKWVHLSGSNRVTLVDDAADSVAGIAAANAQIVAWVDMGSGSLETSTTASGSGDWVASFGYDIQPGGTGGVEVYEADGDAHVVLWRARDPRVWADPVNDTFGWEEFAEDAAVNVTVDLDGNPLTLADNLYTYSFEAGVHQADYPGDLPPNAFVTAQQAGTTKQLFVADLAVTGVRDATDEIWGTCAGTGQVRVWAHDGGQQVSADIVDGAWTTSLAPYDLLPDCSGTVEYAEPDGDATRVDWRAPTPVVWADIAVKSIGVEQYPPSTAVQFTVDSDGDPGNGTLFTTNVTTDEQGLAEIGPDDAPELENLTAGMHVTASDGSDTTKTVVIETLGVTALYGNGGRVVGVSAPDAAVAVRSSEDGVLVEVIADTQGEWTAVLGRDFVNGELGSAQITDAEGDRTVATWQYWPPGIGADTLTDSCEAWGYPVGSSLTFTVDGNADPGDGVLYTWGGTVDETGALATDETFEFDIQAGMYVRCTDGFTPRELLAEDIRVTWVDAANDRMGGTAPAGRQLHMYTGDETVGSFEADGSGDWTFDFAALASPIDIVPGSTGMVFDRDADSDNNLAYWRGDMAPPVTSVVSPQSSYDDIANISLTATDDNDATPTTWWKLDDGEWTAGTSVSTSVVGSHTLHFYSEDASGNREVEKSFGFEVLAMTRYEQDDPLISYPGNWTTLTNASAFSGGTLARANSSGAGVSIRFSGTALNLIGYTGPLYGKAWVTVDGGEPEYIDFYNPANTGKQLVWRKTGLAEGVHDVHLEWANLKNPASGSYMICLDAIDLSGTLLQAPIRYEQDNPLISYPGNWTTLTSASAFSGGSLARASSSGSGISIRFDGTALDLIGYTGPLYGKARVTVDGGEPEYIDFYNPANTGKQRVWRKTGLAEGVHDLHLEWVNLKNPASGGYMICLDAIDLSGTLLQAAVRYEQDNALISYHGAWTTLTSASAFSGGTLARTNSAEAELSIRFNGTALDLVGYTGPLYGKARVTVDGGEPEYIDFYSPANTGKQLVWRKTGLSSGIHSVRLEWANLKNPASGGYMICLDAVDVDGTLQAPLRYEQDNALISYQGTWTTLTSASAFSGGTLARANSSGAALSIRFSGTGLDLIGYTGPLYGKARVTIDGGEPEYIDFYNPTNIGKQLVWRKAGLADGVHDVHLEWTNLKNPASGGYMVCLDAVDVAGMLLQANE